MRRMSQPQVVLLSFWVATGLPFLSACNHKAAPAKTDVDAAKTAANQSLGELRAQVEKAQKAVTNAHGRLRALPDDLQGLEPVRSQLMSIEEVQGVEEARVKWISGEIETAASAGDGAALAKMADTAKGAVAGSQGVEKSVVDLTEKLVPFETKAAQFRALSAKGDIFKAALPSGADVLGAKDGLEQHLIEFIDNDKKKVDKKTWYAFDRIAFAENEARLIPEESRHQLENLALILSAYPRVKLAVGTYAATAPSAEAKALFTARLEAVQSALVTLGVSAPRLSVESHGPAAPACKGKDPRDLEACKARSQGILAHVAAK